MQISLPTTVILIIFYTNIMKHSASFYLVERVSLLNIGSNKENSFELAIKEGYKLY